MVSFFAVVKNFNFCPITMDYSLLLGCCYVYCTKINKPYSKGNVRVTISSVKV